VPDVLVGDLMVKATCTDPGNLGLGEKLTLSAPAQTVYLFDRESGARI